MITTKVCQSQQEWDEMMLEMRAHPLQLWGWGELKTAHNWLAERIVICDEERVIGGAQVLIRRLPSVLGELLYVPRGPVATKGREAEVLGALVGRLSHTHRGLLLQIEPDIEQMPEITGWRQSTNTILIPSTLILDLSKTQDELQAAMTKKTRQYIRKSSKEQVEVRRLKGREELAKCLAIYHETASRAGFALHDDEYYYDVADMLGESSVIFASFYQGEPVAFLWLTVSQETAFELYGGMTDEGQRLRANYALKWHAIMRCKEWGISRYDMNGLLGEGVSTFKRGFADHENLLAGTYDYPLSPLYPIWSTLLPTAKKILRRLKR